MSERRSFYRKVIYLVVIAALWIPLSLLSQPASLDNDGNRSPGGKLAQLRDQYQLSQATLGEIDPTSETIKLATLGMRGVAVQLLWNSAQEYQKTENWTSLSAVLKQIIRLQPNFFSVWDFQAHNLSYNISVEFDDYRDRFFWVMEGINFLKDGVNFNQTDPRFLARLGWFYSNKIGRSDEHVQYRRLFRKLQEEKGEKHTDNWLVGYDWYTEAQNLVDSGKPLRVYLGGDDRRAKAGERVPSPVLFHSEPSMALIYYAETLEEDGTFGETAKAEWENAAHEWQTFINRDLPTNYGYTVRLIDLEGSRKQIEDLQQQIDKLAPGELKKAKQEKLAKLSSEERTALDKPAQSRTPEETDLAAKAQGKTDVTWQEVALRAPPEHRAEARKLSDDLADLTQKSNTIDTYRDIVNYYYWASRCEAEPTDSCLAARELLYKAGNAYANGELFDARDLYEKSFDQWRVVLDRYPLLEDSTVMAEELCDEIDKYKKLLGKIGKKFPDKFVLQDMVDLKEGKRFGPHPEAGPKHDMPEPRKSDAKGKAA
jgi:hypothetical protein